jgi:hypothetical protein
VAGRAWFLQGVVRRAGALHATAPRAVVIQ